jgi:hypothetical protein
MKLLAALVVISAFMAFPAAMALPDSLYMTVANGTQRCVALQLPDDSGWHGRGDVEYTISMEPPLARSWSDFSEQVPRRISENNTNIIPICFARKGNSSCGERFTLTINSSAGTVRVIQGGVCESSVAGVSTAPAPAGQAPAQALNQNFGLFDVGFSERSYHAKPNGVVNITVLAGSHEAVSIHLELSSGVQSVSPPYYDASFSSLGGQREVKFQLQAPAAEGSYQITLSGSVPGCTAQACSMSRTAALIVSRTGAAPVEAGFRTEIFPTSINTAFGSPASFRVTVRNGDAQRNVTMSSLMPYGLSSDFNETAFNIEAGGQRTILFTVTPTGNQNSYDFSIYADSGDNRKLVTGYINVNGMEAGAQRALEAVQATGNQNAIQQANSAYNQWRSNPTTSSYGTLQNELNRLATQQGQAAATDKNTTPPSSNNGVLPNPQEIKGIDIFGKDMWILILIAAAGLVVSMLFFMKGKKGGKKERLSSEFVYKEPT